jgi:hypothetical protein
LIHPIAGKCKHCKADLTAYRAARPAANAPLPALSPGRPGTIASNGQPGNGPPGNGHPIHAPVAHALAMPPLALDAGQAVLPPRPTGYVHAAAPKGAWRSWPMFVIVVAMLAIVAAVVLMMWPASRGRDGKRALQPPPAPERMDTQTPPIAPHIDSSTAPRPAPPQAAPADPTPAAPPDPGSAQADPDEPDLDAVDAINAPGPTLGGGRHGLALNAGDQVMRAMTARLCRRIMQCGNTDPRFQGMCGTVSRWSSLVPAGCPAARRCLEQIDAIGCTASSDAAQMTMQLAHLGDCAEAMRC